MSRVLGIKDTKLVGQFIVAINVQLRVHQQLYKHALIFSRCASGLSFVGKKGEAEKGATTAAPVSIWER